MIGDVYKWTAYDGSLWTHHRDDGDRVVLWSHDRICAFRNVSRARLERNHELAVNARPVRAAPALPRRRPWGAAHVWLPGDIGATVPCIGMCGVDVTINWADSPSLYCDACRPSGTPKPKFAAPEPKTSNPESPIEAPGRPLMSWGRAYVEAARAAGRYRREVLLPLVKDDRDREVMWRYYGALCDDIHERWNRLWKLARAAGYDYKELCHGDMSTRT